MTIRVTCRCGKTLKTSDENAGKKARCPGCGALFVIPQSSVPLEGDPNPGYSQTHAPPLSPEPPLRQAPFGSEPQGRRQDGLGLVERPPGQIRENIILPPLLSPGGRQISAPAAMPDKLRSPGYPPCWLDISTEGASVKASFDPLGVMSAFVEAFARYVRKRYDVRLGPPPTGSSLAVHVRVVSIDEGNRAMRYFLTFLAGKTCFEVEGHLIGPLGHPLGFNFKNKGWGGFFGGNSEALLKLNAKNVAKKVGKLAWNNFQ